MYKISSPRGPWTKETLTIMVLNLWIKWRRQGKEEGEETELLSLLLSLLLTCEVNIDADSHSLMHFQNIISIIYRLQSEYNVSIAY